MSERGDAMSDRRARLLRWWSADFLASFGDGLRLAAFPLLAAALTRSPAVIAAVVAAQGLPWLVVGPAAGVLVDRHDPRAIVATADGLQGLAVALLAVLVLAHADTLGAVFAAALVTGVAAAVRSTANQAGVPRLVAADDLERVNGRLVAGEIVGNELLGPAAGGWLFGVAAALPFGLDAGGLGIALALVVTLPTIAARARPAPAAPAPPAPPAPPARRALGELREGVSWLAHDRAVRTLTLASATVALVDAAWFAVLVLYVTDVLHRGSGDYGGLLAAGAAGGIAAGAASGRLAGRLGPATLLATSIVVMAATQLVLGLTADLPLAGGMLACSSGAFATFNVAAVTMRQRRVPAELFGRVTSVYSALAGGAEAIGALLGGGLASVAGIRAPMLAGVVPLLLVAALVLSRRPPDVRADGFVG